MRASPRLVKLLLCGTLPAALAGIWPAFGWLALGFDACVLAAVLADIALTRQRWPSLVRRTLPQRVSRGSPFGVRFELVPAAAPSGSFSPEGVKSDCVEVLDHFPPEFEPREARFELQPGAAIERSLRALRRGQYRVPAPAADQPTPLGLGRIKVQTEADALVSVLPDTRLLGRYDALVRQGRLREIGLARVRDRGEGTEIAGLRPYALGDPYARVDWKASARRGALASREMHTERRQTVIIALDCGRRMAGESDGQNRLDHAIEAALLLAHVALRSDDRVGFAAFDDRLTRVVQPLRGHAGASALAQAMFGLEPALREPPYQAIAAQLSHHFRRRALIVLFTDAAEPTSLDLLARPIHFLSRRHLVLCVMFRDRSIERALSAPPEDVDAFFRAGAAAQLHAERERGLRRLKRSGALVLEAAPGQLSSAAINRYLEVKARRLL